jgi:anaerobic selenocysteine-containing dehydrogenase
MKTVSPCSGEIVKIVKTMCARDCPDACWLDVTVDNDSIIKVDASTDNPVTNGLTCPRALGDPERTKSRDRVMYPYVRKDDSSPEFTKASWDDAIDLVTSKLRQTIEEHGRESVLLLDYAGNCGVISSGYSKRLWNALGVTMTDYTICSASGHAGLHLHYGLSYGCQPQDLCTKKTIVFWGFNAKTSSPHQWALAATARRDHDAEIVVVDPRKSETALLSDQWIGPKPGTDVALAYGIAHYLITNDLVDMDFIKSHTHGYEAYRDEALKWTPERVENVTGVSWNDIKRLCKMLTENGPSVFMLGLGLNKSMTGAESCRAVSLLPSLLGQHRGIYYTNPSGRYIGGDSTGSGLTMKKPKVVSMISLGERLAAGEFRFVYVFGMNPAMTLPDSNKVVQGLQRPDVFLVVHDSHITETTNLADVTLPAATYLEKDDIYTSDSHPYVRMGRRAIWPVAESIDEHLLMKTMAEKLDVQEPWVYADPWEEMSEGFKEAFEDGSFSDLMEGKELQLRHRPLDYYPTGTGKMEFSSTSAPEGVSALPVQMKIPVEKDEFIMLNSAIPNYTHTQFTEVYGDIPCMAWINPADVEEMGLNPDAKATLYNDLGEFVVDLKPTKQVSRGVIWCPREAIDSEGNHQNGLSHGTPQPIGGGPMFNTVKIRVRQ